jgi:hypothetical protein
MPLFFEGFDIGSDVVDVLIGGCDGFADFAVGGQHVVLIPQKGKQLFRRPAS